MALIVREYLTADGKNPFREWLGTLTTAVRARIQARVLRFELGIARAQGAWRDFLEAKRHGKAK